MGTLTVQGYYDGVNIRLLEKIPVKPNRRIIVTIADELAEPEQPTRKKSLRGALSEYADPERMKREEGAWERAAAEKYRDF